jgi:hypothetical protein
MPDAPPVHAGQMTRRRACICLAVPMLAATPPAVAQSGPTLAESSAATRLVAEPYFAAYVARDWDKLAPLLADAAHFADPTAEPVFGKIDVQGKASVLKNFREGYADIKHMQFHKTRAFFSGGQAIFEGALDWTLRLDGGREVVTQAMPLVTILRIESGQVVDHTDLADYRFFIEAHRKAKSGG